MGYVNPRMLEPGNVWLFDHCIRKLPNGAVIEIGSFCGLSLNHIAYLLAKHNRDNPVFSADEWHFGGANFYAALLGDTQIPTLQHQKLLIDTFRRNVSLFSTLRLPHHIQASSDAFFDAWVKELPKLISEVVRLP